MKHKYKEYTLICTYTEKLVPKEILPLFIVNKPNRVLHIKIPKSTFEEEKSRKKFLDILNNWYRNFTVQSILDDNNKEIILE